MDVESRKDAFDEFIIVEVAIFLSFFVGVVAGLGCEDGVFYALSIGLVAVELLASEDEALDAEVKLATEIGLQSNC